MTPTSNSFTRAYPRRRCSAKVAVLRAGNLSFELGVQLSEGGMLIRCDRALAIGDRLELNMVIPGGGFVATAAEVLYRFEPTPGETHYGVRFLDPSPFLRYEIRRYVTSGT